MPDYDPYDALENEPVPPKPEARVTIPERVFEYREWAVHVYRAEINELLGLAHCLCDPDLIERDGPRVNVRRVREEMDRTHQFYEKLHWATRAFTVEELRRVRMTLPEGEEDPRTPRPHVPPGT